MNTNENAPTSTKPANPATGKHIKSRAAAVAKDAPKTDNDPANYATNEQWGVFL